MRTLIEAILRFPFTLGVPDLIMALIATVALMVVLTLAAAV